MINKSSAASLAVTTAVVILSFVCPPEIVNVGLVFFDDVIFNPLPHDKRVPKTKGVIEEKIFSALATLSLQGQQSVLVQLWSPTKAGNTFLLYTCKTFGFRAFSYEIDKGLMVYRSGCLCHAFYVHREKNVSFGLPGLAFMEGTPQQTQDVHNYPQDQRPPCEDDAIFSMKWGSFTVPVTLDDECVGVLEFVFTGPTGPYDVYMNEVCKALEFVGFQSSQLDTPKRTCIAKKSRSSNEYDAPTETGSSKKKTRTTQSSMYAHYNVLVPLFGLSKAEAMKEIANIFHLSKIVKESTFTNALKKVGITEWPRIRNTHTRASSSAPETQSNPAVSEAASSIGTPDSVLTSVCDAVISEQLREQTLTSIASAFEAQLNQTLLETSPVIAEDFNQYRDNGFSEMSWEQTPTMEPSALGLPERLLAFVSELDEMEEDQDYVGVYDPGRFNDILTSFEECLHNTSGGMEIDIAPKCATV